MRLLRRAIRQVFEGVPGRLPRKVVSSAARLLIVSTVTLANAVGAVMTVTLLLIVLPAPDEGRIDDPGALAVSAAYALAAILYGTVRGLHHARPVVHMFERESEPTEDERKAVLRLPALATRLQLGLWFFGALVFGIVAAVQVSVLYGIEVACTVGLAGLATSGVTYLLFQRLLRGAVHIALVHNPPRRREVPGVALRVVLAWGLGTAVPVAGALIVSIVALTVDIESDQLARTMLVLSAIALLVGFLAMMLVARTLSDPLRRLRDAFAAVVDGVLEAEVPVFDATEVGYAAAGFNRMLEGLRERERLHDLFGRQVGSDVARQALEEGVTLGGEEREAAVLFVDIIGSTTFAADRPPTEVVEVLNDFFATVVEVTQEHGGLVNKFAGDAALCVFGAPLARQDPAGSALAAAREMCNRLRDSELEAGIGVSAGTVVAGNIGTSDRYEYTVIGDPVNEAARLTELAKERPSRVLASGAALERAGTEAHGWTFTERTVLRGRLDATDLAAPRS